MSATEADAPGRSSTSRFGTPAQRAAVGVILLFCVVTRVGWLLHIRDANPAATTSNDTPSYVQPARALARDGALNLRPGSRDPIFVRTPGYPGLMGTVFVVHESETLFLVIQALLSCLTVLAAYVIATRLWSATAGLAAAVLLALEPLQFAAAGTLLTESLSSLALLCVVGLGFGVFTGGMLRPKWCVLLGLAVAVATLIRPTTYYLPIFTVVLMIVAARRAGVRKIATGIALFALPIVVLIGGWQVRNHFDVGTARFSGIEAVNIYHYRAAHALARADGINPKTALLRLDTELSSSMTAKCEPKGQCAPADPSRPGPYFDEILSRGVTVILDHPVPAAEDAARGLGRELFGPGTETVGRYLDVRSSTPLKLALAAALAFFYLATAFGLFLVGRKPGGRGLGHLFAVGTAAYVLLVSAGPETYARFRGPVMPILALYAGFGIATACGRTHRSRGRLVAHDASNRARC